MTVKKSSLERSPHYGILQELCDELFAETEMERRLTILVRAESYGLPKDLIEIVELLPPGDYSRRRFCDQINSALTGHGWGLVYGTIE